MTGVAGDARLDGVVIAAVVTGGGAGALAGLGVRAVLARMRRGVLVPRAPCATALAVLWAVPAGVVVAGAAPAAWLPAWLGLGALVVAGSATDLAARRLPDALTRPATVLALAALAPLGLRAVLVGVLGAVCWGVGHAVVHLVAPGALGAGDVKLAPALGAPLAAASWAALAVAPVLAAAGVLALVLARGGRSTTVPFGPPVLGAAWVALAAVVITP
ncbi:prepilin peptidase [Actinomycetospora cinnamomea]|uniref:Leader peptidase (Prepilin peptidase)/N-methyltransferase n=1 Tax=Actinomycetospora cinnamomea TaxID=663609 RepID=A0A2U1FI33_9PSEU|nr:prepilin peptidase [Actinomycetospora cinnamomea]PVZ11817.1 leader peptidase (prepilin peptidase)/N-methyltransferase [Actinomycetospora cinnamomea]